VAADLFLDVLDGRVVQAGFLNDHRDPKGKVVVAEEVVAVNHLAVIVRVLVAQRQGRVRHSERMSNRQPCRLIPEAQAQLRLHQVVDLIRPLRGAEVYLDQGPQVRDRAGHVAHASSLGK
jgi:hypothetical protein